MTGYNLTGNSGTNLEVESTNATRVTYRPADYGTLGSYSAGATSGVMAAGLGAAAVIYHFRNGGPNIVNVKRVLLGAVVAGTAFTAGTCVFFLQMERNSSTPGVGTGLTLTGNNTKLRTSMGTTGISNIQISTTAAISSATLPVEAIMIGQINTSVPATASIPIVPPLTPLFDSRINEAPLTLLNTDSFQILATVGTTGTWSFSVNVYWDELLMSTLG